MSRGVRKETCYIFSHEQYQKTLCYPFGCAEETQHLQLEPWTPTGKRRCLRKTKLQEGGISLPSRRRLTTLTTSFSRIASTLPSTQVVQFSSTRTPSTPTSMSGPSTFMTQDESYPIKSWTENRDGFLQSVLFTCLISSITSERAEVLFTVLSLHVSNIYAKQKGIAKKVTLTLRAIMISQEVDLVAGDFNGTAWRYRSKDNLSTLDEAFTDCTFPTPPGRTPLWGPGSIPDMWADDCGCLRPPGSRRFWKVSKHGAFSNPRKTLGLRPKDQSFHHQTWLHHTGIQKDVLAKS